MNRLAHRLPRLGSVRWSSGAPHYNRPSGWLFGEKPLPPGQKRQPEPWEGIWYWGFYGGTAVAMIAYMYKPGQPITVWAREEAKKTMGEEPTYERT